ncbi:CotH kinase family protein [Polyangium mundeleinium]|uniref:CotH kinase family protein n=1 Tax=Polyangium mundeleinium TaxID=2995306 RepID=A0ABT5ET96_9BACT|nr:CotH kinase family protein [Polyangium mundeleinium]MDC0745048.1 CotH kinase family protein [Polyangium mundeleinium]
MRYRLASILLFSSAFTGCTAEDPVEAVFDPAKLHKVEITVASTYLGTLANDLDERVPCDIVYDGELVAGSGIRQKGNTLVDLDDKPSFSIKFDEFDDQAKLYGLNKLILNSSKQDPSFLRSRLGSDVHLRAGLPAARVAHAQVTLNGVDKGIYVVVEAVDKDFLRSHFGEEFAEGNLYEGPCCGDFVDDIEHMELEDEKKDGRSRDDLRALAQVIQDTPDAEFATALEEHLDLGQFMKIYALEALLGHWDGFAFRANNHYIYNNPATGRFVFMPHGMDRILDDPSFDPETTPVTKLPLRIRALTALDMEFQTQRTELARNAWNETSMQAVINQAAAVLHTAAAGEQTSKDLADFDEGVTELRNIVTVRSDKIAPTN